MSKATMAKKIEEQAEQIENLKKYVQHEPGCACVRLRQKEKFCNCGLKEIKEKKNEN